MVYKLYIASHSLMVYKLYIATGCFLRGFPFALVMSEPLDHCMECADVQQRLIDTVIGAVSQSMQSVT